MSPGSHFLISWLSSVAILKDRRERIIVTYAGIAPDIDGSGIIIDFFTGTTYYYHSFHHYIGHSLIAAIIFSILSATLAKYQKKVVLLLSFLVIHIHYLCDIIGSRAPDGFQWPLYYLYPFNVTFELKWSGQWELSSWQNLAILFISLLLSAFIIAKKEITPFEIFNKKINTTANNMFKKYILRK